MFRFPFFYPVRPPDRLYALGGLTNNRRWQTILKTIQTSGATLSKLSLLLDLVMTQRNKILRANLADSVPLNGYDLTFIEDNECIANKWQIRIVVDTKQDEKPNKKKKKHRGYAFVVYEREKDMRGKMTETPFRNHASRTPIYTICKDMALKLPIFSLSLCTAL